MSARKRPKTSARLRAPSAPASSPMLAGRFVAASGAQFDDEQAEVYGRELLRIAEENRVDGIRSLDKRLVYRIVANDPNSPLRDFIWNKTEQESAAEYRVERCALLLRQVRIVSAHVGARETPTPVFLSVESAVKRGDDDGAPRIRSRVLTADVLANDPLYASSLSQQIRALKHALARIEHVTSMRPTPTNIVALRDAIRAALTRYERTLVKAELDAAAEE